jgi:formylglycine-generating enzyme required for sulfatase activity
MEQKMRPFLISILLVVAVCSGHAAEDRGNTPSKPIFVPRKSRTNSVGMKLVSVPRGSFMMGSPEKEKNRCIDEPEHKVIIAKAFFIQTTEVTQGQWKAVMKTSPWKGKKNVKEGDDYPAVFITWNDARQFVEKLNSKEGTNVYRLPTEDEWEYACRAGTSTAYYWGKSMDADYCWYHGKKWGKKVTSAHEVKAKKPNPWGLYDMSGNVSEWCSNWYTKDYTPDAEYKGPLAHTYKVTRGGSFLSQAPLCRSAARIIRNPKTADLDSGFRVVMDAD